MNGRKYSWVLSSLAQEKRPTIVCRMLNTMATKKSYKQANRRCIGMRCVYHHTVYAAPANISTRIVCWLPVDSAWWWCVCVCSDLVNVCIGSRQNTFVRRQTAWQVLWRRLFVRSVQHTATIDRKCFGVCVRIDVKQSMIVIVYAQVVSSEMHELHTGCGVEREFNLTGKYGLNILRIYLANFVVISFLIGRMKHNICNVI